MPVRGSFVDNPSAASRGQLRCITRAVYVMQSHSEPRLFRFGLIGAGGSLTKPPTDTNSAWNRPRQCSRTWRRNNAAEPEVFRFVFLCSTPEATKSEIKELEKALRQTFFMNAEPFERFQNGLLEVRRYKDNLRDLAAPRDAFVVRRADDIPLAVVRARDAIQPYLVAG